MAAVVLICAPSEKGRAAELVRRLEAGGRQVRLATQEIDYLDPRVPAIVLWSRACIDWGPALFIARAAASYGSLIPVSLEPVDPPIRIEVSPLDMSKWRGEASLTWRTLIERIENVERRSETRATRHHFLPMMAMAATGLMVVGFASMLRTEDGTGPANLVRPAQRVLAAAAVGEIQNVSDHVGGPDYLPDTLEPDRIDVALIDAPNSFGRKNYGTLSNFEQPLPLAQVALRRDSILGQILRPARDVRDMLREVASEL